MSTFTGPWVLRRYKTQAGLAGLLLWMGAQSCVPPSFASANGVLLPCCKPTGRANPRLHGTPSPPAAHRPVTEAKHTRFGVFTQQRSLQQPAQLLSSIALHCRGGLWVHLCPHPCMHFCSHDREALLTAVFFVPLPITGTSERLILHPQHPLPGWHGRGLQTESRWDAEHK